MPPVSTATQDDLDWLLAAYDYDLPEDLIAQNPVEPRDSARLLVVDSARYQHHLFRDLPNLLQPGDLLVLNNTRVIPARLFEPTRPQAGESCNLINQLPYAVKGCESSSQ